MKKNLKKKINSMLHSNSVFVQLIVFSIFISVIPFSIGSMIFVNQISDTMEETLNKSYTQLVRQYMYNLNDSLFRYEDRLLQIADNTVILDELRAAGENTNAYVRGEKISAEVSKCLRIESHKEFKNCMIYSSLWEYPIYGRRVSMMKEANKEIWYTDYAPVHPDHFMYQWIDNKTQILSLLHNINYVDTNNFTKQNIGIVKLDIYAGQLFMPTQASRKGSYPYDVIVMDQNNRFVYSSNEQYCGFAQNVSFDALSSEKMKQQDDMIIFGDTTSRYGMRVIFLFDKAMLLAEKNAMLKIYLPILFGVISVIAFVGILFSRSFSRRVARLVNKIKLAETGNLSVTEEIKGNDEIAVLDRQFNQMLERLNGLIHKNYIQQLEKKETELKNLQLQINPHFLYNTLETISSAAAVKQAFEVCDLCGKLGDVFRYSLGKNSGGGDYVTVLQELNHIKNYIFIQKARFGNKFDVAYSVDTGLERMEIPRFILQPLVENAIVHGLSKNTGKGSLDITVFSAGEELFIRVMDNGSGMSPERLADLTQYIYAQENEPEAANQSIGVRNVHQRIRLSCGEAYGISIDSRLHYGSSFTIKLPLKEQGEKR